MSKLHRLGLAALLLSGLLAAVSCSHRMVRVGSKKFTESYVLGEVARGLLLKDGYKVEHKQGMGGSSILWQALKSGEIDAYPEYTGTISEELLKRPDLKSIEYLRFALEDEGIGATNELGFDDTYALCMTEKRAQELGITKISDLAAHPDLVVGVTVEFLGRKDGWRPLSEKYGLNMSNVKAIEHDLGYAALRSGQIEVKDAYSTDAKIAEYGLRVLEDDRHYFPEYKAVFLYRLTAPKPLIASLKRIEGKIDAKRMTAMNARAEKTKNYTTPAEEFLATTLPKESLAQRLTRWVARHLQLVVASLLLAILVGIPLGILASRPGPTSAFILGIVGVMQTIPSLALLALLVAIPGLGIGVQTAILALFLYSLLPIVRNTATGLQDVPPSLREAAAAIGLTEQQRLWKVYMPMASRSILAGIKTAAVINIGTATLAGLIGAGGLGEPINSGLNLNDVPSILQGAVPAALLALLAQAGFDTLDRVIIPKGLRLGQTRS